MKDAVRFRDVSILGFDIREYPTVVIGRHGRPERRPHFAGCGPNVE